MFSNNHLLNPLRHNTKRVANSLALTNPATRTLTLPSMTLFGFVLLLVGMLFVTISNGSELTAEPRYTGGVCLPSGNQTDAVSDLFDGDGPLIGYTTNGESALPDVIRKDGRYNATLLNNDNNVTLHFNNIQGRLDAKRLAFPFEYIARNIGIGTLTDSQVAPAPDDFPSPSDVYMFAGIQVHVLDLEKRDSAHFVVGHRGSASFTVEGKNTVSGSSRVNDAGQGIVPSGRADLRVVGDADKTLTWYWQQPNMDSYTQADDWIPYRGSGRFPGQQANFGDEVYIGLITYAFNEANVGFVGTCDSIELIDNTP